MADCQDRNIGRGLGRLCVSRFVNIVARSFDPFLEAGQHSLSGLLRGSIAFVRASNDRSQAPIDFICSQLDIRKHEPEESFHR